MSDITPQDFPYISSKDRIENVDASENLAGTIGGMGSTPISAVGTAINNDGTVNAPQLTGEAPIITINIAARGWGQSCVFTLDGSTPATKVNWSIGYLTSADGTDYAIDAGTTGVMSAKTYIYFYPGTGAGQDSTAFQLTTDYSVAIGAGKVFIGIARNGTVEATFITFNGSDLNINGQDIAQGSITTDEIAANTILAANLVANIITGNYLAAEIAYLGSLEIDTGGNIRSGKTAYGAGTGWYIGDASGGAKVDIGSLTNYLRWDGTSLILKGAFDVGSNAVINNAVYTVANLPAVPTVVGFNNPSAWE